MRITDTKSRFYDHEMKMIMFPHTTFGTIYRELGRVNRERYIFYQAGRIISPTDTVEEVLGKFGDMESEVELGVKLRDLATLEEKTKLWRY